MENLFYINLFIFGTLFGSFSSVIIYRLKSGESGILNGRSRCSKCKHVLGAGELIPIVSWIKNLGKCKYCKSKIPAIYPFLELCTGILFTLIGYFLIDINLILEFNLNEIIKLLFWLSIGFITIIYSFYDILFKEIHDGVMFVGIGISLLLILLELLGITNILNYIGSNNNDMFLNILSFLILLIIITALYIIIFKELKWRYDFLIIGLLIILLYGFSYLTKSNIEDFMAVNVSIGILIIFNFLFIQIALSNGKWMGGGDLRIAILLGLLVGYTFSIETILFTYLVGSIISIGIVIHQKIKKGFKFKVESEIPFGPFLAIGFFISIFMKTPIQELLMTYL